MKTVFTANPLLVSIIAAAALSVPALSSAANVGEANTQTVELVFREPVQITHNLSEEKNLISGKVSNDTQLAKGSILITSGQPDAAIITFDSISNDESGRLVSEVSGETDEKNKLKLYLISTSEVNEIGAGQQFGINEYYGIKASFSSGKKIEYNVKTFGDQNVKPDSYVVKVKAYAYNN